MSISDLLWLIALIITHSLAYYMGSTADNEPFKPSDQAWVAVQCHAIDKQYEYARWSKEHEQIKDTAASSD